MMKARTMLQLRTLCQTTFLIGFACLFLLPESHADAADPSLVRPVIQGATDQGIVRVGSVDHGDSTNVNSSFGQGEIQLAQSKLAQPQGPVILTISGAITNTNGEGVAKLDREMLLSLGQHELRTTTSWTEGVKTFRGVLANDVLEYVGAYGSTITATALNDYVVEIPVSDFEKYGVVFALWMDGEQLTRRTKGPIWPVYPRDEFPELMNRASDKKWIWQLVTIEIR